MQTLSPSRLRAALLVALGPVLVGLWVAATTLDRGGRLLPWEPTMVDLEVYRRAGRALLDGRDVYATAPGELPFLYPPFAAVLSVPLAVLPQTLVELAWTVACVLALLAVLHRCGLHGRALGLAGAAAVLLVEPVAETLGYGQVGILLVALVVLDLVPGPRLLSTVTSRRLLPQGTLTALAVAVKLTPAVLVVYLLVVGRRRAAAVATAAFLAVTGASAAVAPDASVHFWSRLGQGETGVGSSVAYYTNQSVLADVVRTAGLGSTASAVGLLLSAAVAALGVGAAVRWHRAGEAGLAVCLCGVASLLASPISWVHHFVWVVPLAALLATRARDRAPLPKALTVPVWLFVGWVAAAPVRLLPHGGAAELAWSWPQDVLGSLTAVLGVALLVAAVRAAVPGPRPAPTEELALTR